MLIAVTVILIAVLFYPWLNRQVQIDKCLDAGGKWNYELNKCETK